MASAAAALAARARREIQHQFFAADAVRSDRAVAFSPANHFEERQFARLRDRDIVREDMDGRYWLDLPAYDIYLCERHARVRLALIVIVALFAVSVTFAGVIGARQTTTVGEHGQPAPAADSRGE